MVVSISGLEASFSLASTTVSAVKKYVTMTTSHCRGNVHTSSFAIKGDLLIIHHNHLKGKIFIIMLPVAIHNVQ